METKLNIIYKIEPESKHNKLLEELNELTVDIKKYIKEPSDDNMELALGEYIDLGIVLLQLAIVRHRQNIAEIWSTAIQKVNTGVIISKLMKKRKIGYKAARKIVRE